MNLRAMSIKRKILIGYAALVLLPVIIFMLFYYGSVNAQAEREIRKANRDAAVQSYNSMRVVLSVIENACGELENNPALKRYLMGFYITPEAALYSYLNDNQFLLSKFTNMSPHIRFMNIYNAIGGIPVFGANFHTLSQFYTQRHSSEALAFLDNDLLASQWCVEEASYPVTGVKEIHTEKSLVYRQKLYSGGRTYMLGMAEVIISLDIFSSAIGTSQDYAFLRRDGEMVHRSEGFTEKAIAAARELLAEMESPATGQGQSTSEQSGPAAEQSWLITERSGFASGASELITVLWVRAFSQYLAMLRPLEGLSQRRAQLALYMAGMTALFLMFFSFLYYIIIVNLTRRINRLAAHIAGMETGVIPYRSTGNDEIGMLEDAFSEMAVRLNTTIENLKTMEQLNREAAYAVLRAQVKPHFLYNTVESIRMLAIVNDDEKTAEALYAFGKMTHYALNAHNDKTLLSDEIVHVQNYLRLQKIRMGEQLEFSIDLPDNSIHIPCPYLIIQPIAENCFRHGFKNGRDIPFRVHVSVSFDDHYAMVTVRDNGEGIRPERLGEINLAVDQGAESIGGSDGGIGIINVHKRLKAFFGNGSGLSIGNAAPGGAIAVLRMYCDCLNDGGK